MKGAMKPCSPAYYEKYHLNPFHGATKVTLCGLAVEAKPRPQHMDIGGARIGPAFFAFANIVLWTQFTCHTHTHYSAHLCGFSTLTGLYNQHPI